MQLYSGEDSLVDSFPHALEKMEGARRYISAFRAPLQELSPAQAHALRACSLLVIPPPKEGGLHLEASQRTCRTLTYQAGPAWSRMSPLD